MSIRGRSEQVFMKVFRGLVVVGFLALTGCNGGTDLSEILDVSLDVSAAVVSPDEPVSIRVTATNHGIRSITIQSNHCPEAFVVLDAAGEVVGPAGKICTLVPREEVLLPGEQFVFERTWAADGNSGEFGRPPMVLQAGEYWLRGQVSPVGGFVFSATVPVRVESSGTGWTAPSRHRCMRAGAAEEARTTGILGE